MSERPNRAQAVKMLQDADCEDAEPPPEASSAPNTGLGIWQAHAQLADIIVALKGQVDALSVRCATLDKHAARVEEDRRQLEEFAERFHDAVDASAARSSNQE